jgi:energy-coupling factor transport system permease protein
MRMTLEERGPLGLVDVRAKLAWVFATLVAGLVMARPLPLLLMLMSILAVALVGGVVAELSLHIRSLVMIMLLFGLIFGLTIGGTPLLFVVPSWLPLGPALPLSREGLLLGVVSALRILIFAVPLVLVIMTTSTADLITGLLWLRLPVAYALMIVLALTFVPVALAEWGRIADAQRARGLALMDGGFLARARALVPLFVPLTLNAVDRADTVGKVLEMRGVARNLLRPEFAPLNRGSWALLAMAIVLAVGAVVTLWM